MKEALAKPRNDRLSMFDSFKKLGIENFNKCQLNENEPKLYRERKHCNSKPEHLVECSNCKGFFARRYWSRHEKRCGECVPPVAIKVSVMQSTLDVTYF